MKAISSFWTHLSCCSFLASCSRAWKSTDSSATMEFTASTPDSSRRMSFLSCAQALLWSAGAQRAILTRQGSRSRSSGSLKAASLATSTFCMASNANEFTNWRLALSAILRQRMKGKDKERKHFRLKKVIITIPYTILVCTPIAIKS